MVTLGQNISALRKKRGLSQAQLAEKLDIGTSTLGMYETNKREPSYETLSNIANFFNTSVDELLGRNTNSKPAPLKDGTALTWSDLDMPMPYGGKLPEELKDTYIDLAKSYFKRHPEMLNKDE